MSQQSFIFVIIIMSLGVIVFDKPSEPVKQVKVITLPPLDIDEPVRAYSEHNDGYIGVEK